MNEASLIIAKEQHAAITSHGKRQPACVFELIYKTNRYNSYTQTCNTKLSLHQFTNQKPLPISSLYISSPFIPSIQPQPMNPLLHPRKRNPQPHTTPQPLIPKLLNTGPKRINIFVCSICIEGGLPLTLVSCRLVSFCCSIPAYVS